MFNHTREGRNSEPWLEPLTQAHLVLAQNRLSAFDVVIIVEWLHDANYMAYLKSLFTSASMADIPVRMDASTIRGGYLEFDVDIHMQIEKLNVWDVKLYQFGKELARLRMQKAGYPIESRSEL